MTISGRNRDEPSAGDRGVEVRVRGCLGQGEHEYVECVPGVAEAGQHRVRPATGPKQAPSESAPSAAQLPGESGPRLLVSGPAPAP